MRNIKPTLILLLFVLFLVTPLRVCRAEVSYMIYDSELNQLLKIINDLENNYKQAKSSLQTSKQQLEQQEKQLQTLQNQLTALKSQIEKSENLSIQLSGKLSQAEMDLKTLEESWKQYKIEVESRIRKLTIQRNVCIIIGLIVAFL
jgi:septal ring factor EnvC (AmiA/AmiB activator)